MATKDERPVWGDQKPNASGEFIEDAAATPAELEALGVNEKALLRKV
jgi:hypothetical protein